VIDPAADLVGRCSFALLFATAAYHKLGDFESFGMIMRDYQLLPESSVATAATLLIATEALLAAALFADFHRGAVALSVVALLACYSLAIAVNLVRGRRDIGCGCSGAMHKQLITWWLVLRNVVLMLGGVCLALPLRARPWTALDGCTVVAGVLAISFLYAAANRLMSEWPAHLRTRRPRPMSTGRANL